MINIICLHPTHYFPLATLYFAMGLQSAILTIPAAILQVFDNTHIHSVNVLSAGHCSAMVRYKLHPGRPDWSQVLHKTLLRFL